MWLLSFELMRKEGGCRTTCEWQFILYPSLLSKHKQLTQGMKRDTVHLLLVLDQIYVLQVSCDLTSFVSDKLKSLFLYLFSKATH